MTKEEYLQKLKHLEVEFKINKNSLAEEFALSNNPYKVGDILRDHCQIIRVEKIAVGYAFYTGMPMCVYKGTQLTAKLEPRKRQEFNPMMSQNDVKQKLN